MMKSPPSYMCYMSVGNFLSLLYAIKILKNYIFHVYVCISISYVSIYDIFMHTYCFMGLNL